MLQTALRSFALPRNIEWWWSPSQSPIEPYSAQKAEESEGLLSAGERCLPESRGNTEVEL